MAMPVLFTRQEASETWLIAPRSEALQPRRSLPDGSVRIVARGEKKDGAVTSARRRNPPAVLALALHRRRAGARGPNGADGTTLRHCPFVRMSQYTPHSRSPRRDGTAHGPSRTREASTLEILARGLLAGAVGVAAMTLAEKIEQALTKRPNSYVPARTLERLLALPEKPDSERLWLNWTMHWGQGILLGAVRALMAERGIRGPVGSFLFLNLRLLNDQTLENATRVGAPPWTWPVDEQVIDLMHKAIYAYATGAAADRLVSRPKGLERRKDEHYYT